MATLKWALFCDHVEFQNGKANLLGLVDAILVPNIPATLAQLALVVFVQVRPLEKVVIAVVARDPHGRMLGELGSPETFTSSIHGIHKGVITLDGLPLPQAGEYTFEVLINGKQVHREPLSVKLLQ